MSSSSQPRILTTETAPPEEPPKKEKTKGSAGLRSSYFNFLYKLKPKPVLVALTKSEAQMT